MKLFLSRRYFVETENREGALTHLIQSGVPFSAPRREEKGISFTASFFKRKYFESFFKNLGVEMTSKPEGLISRLFFLKERKGIIIGWVLGFFLIYLSTFYVWSVRIEGNKTLTDSEIIRIMSECGFYEGVKKKDVDVNEIQNEVLKRCHELSFFSINSCKQYSTITLRLYHNISIESIATYAKSKPPVYRPILHFIIDARQKR